MVFMTNANVIFSYGAERFMERAASLGIDGLILPDIPFEEKEEFDATCDKYGLELISMIAPTSGQRISMIAKQAKGFIYLVSSLGITGMRTNITTDIPSMVKIVRESTNVPVAVGFGISTPEQARAMYEASDGAIVGSAIVKIVEKYGRDAAGPVGEYVKSMKAAAAGL
jgi:tryptophan synthase alpha chain